MYAEHVCGSSSCGKLSASFQKLKRKQTQPCLQWVYGQQEGRCTIWKAGTSFCILGLSAWGTISVTQDTRHSDPEVTGKLHRRAGPAARWEETVQRQSDISSVLIIKVYCKLPVLLLPFIQEKNNNSKPTIKQGPGASACREACSFLGPRGWAAWQRPAGTQVNTN